jgi:hypothetical protein
MVKKRKAKKTKQKRKAKRRKPSTPTVDVPIRYEGCWLFAHKLYPPGVSRPDIRPLSARYAARVPILMHNGEDIRRKPFAERKAILRKVLQRTRRGIQ